MANNNDFKVILEAMIDNSSLTNVQKQLAKERLKINADISVEDFAKSKQEIEKQIGKLAKNIKNILGTAITDKQASQWAKQYYDGMVSGAKEAAKAQEKLNAEQRKNTLAEQEKYYKRIIENNKEIYALKEKKLSADKEESKELQRQITNLEKRNKRAYDSISQKGLGDTQWGLEVSNSEKELKNRLAIKEARLQDKANAKEQSLIDKQVAEYNKQEAEYIKLRNKYLAEGKKQEEDFYNSKALESEKAEQQAIANKEKAYQDAYKELKKLYDLRIEYAKIDDPDNNQKYLYENAISKQEDKWRKAYANTSEPENWDVQKRLELQRQEVAMQEKLEHAYGRVTEAKKQSKKVDEIQLLSNGGIKNDYTTQIAQLEGNFRRLGLSQEEVSQKTSKVSTAFGELKKRINEPFNESNYQEIINLNDVLQRELIESTNEYTRLQASFKGFATEQQRLSLANTIEAWNQKNSAATREVVDANNQYILTLRDLSTEMRKVDFDRINTGFKQNENSMRALNRLGKSLKEQFVQAYQSFTMWLSASSAVMKVISETKEAFVELRNINTLLTEISKANDKLTKEQLVQIGNNSFDVASKYGKSASDYLTGVQEASRAGYENAEAMAELSTAAQGAGDMTAEVANQFIIATDKAYKLNGSVTELTKVLDGVNYITNHNAVNMTELSESMTIVGSTAASFGVETNELTAALGTMAATTQQSGSEVARAFRAILLNIRQVSDEEEGIDAEGLTKYEKACNALGVSLKETRNGVLQTRDAMDVLKDLSVEYNKLEENDLRRTELLNSVGGKLRATQLDALLRQWSMYEEMLRQFEDGNGSMQKEAEKTANSWEGASQRVSNTWNDTVENIANSDAIITILNGFNSLLQVVNKFTEALGSLGTISLGAGLFAGIKNVGKGKCNLSFCFE